jgi:cation/acetate symporter
VLGNDSSLFPLKNPALVSMPLAFAVGIVVSLLAPERRAEERFAEAERQIHLGAAAATPATPPPAARPAATEP